MSASETNQSGSMDSYSIKELFLIGRDYLYACLRHRRLCMLGILIGLVVALVYKWNARKEYEAEVSFMLNEEVGSLPGLSSALGSFGGLLGSGDQINLYKILDLARSRRIAEKLLFEKTKLSEEGPEDYLANHLIQELEQQGVWATKRFYQPDHPLKGFRFQSAEVAGFSRLENMALQHVHQALNGMLYTRLSDKTNLMYLTVNGTQEALTHRLCLRLYEELSHYYIDQTVEKQLGTYQGLSRKTDSLKTLMDQKQYSLAGLRDHYRGSWLLTEDVPKTILDQEIRVLQLVYAEAMKNKEVASFALVHKTPFIQSIDLPILPLKSKQLSWPRALMGGVLFGLVGACLFVCMRKYLRDHKVFE